MRLARFGYTSETISLPTREQAPEDFAAWRPQRSRWFKGWAQAWLVHMRDPAAVFDELGPRAFAVMQLMLGGMLASALLHPLIFVTAMVYAVMLLGGHPLDRWQVMLFGVDTLNLLLSYGAFLYLGWRNILATERPRFWSLAAFTPIYWMLLSYAAWRAIFELMRAPHKWNKTPHKAPEALRVRTY